MRTGKHAIVLFDGVCNLCNSSVKFMIEHDPDDYFRYASLQGEEGKRLLAERGISGYFGSFVLIEDGKLYTKSGAALRICGRLSGVWKLGYLFLAVPPPLRNAVYGFVANRRYKWFGKRESCMLPSPDVRSRFLD
ncbi:DCC1-like thiol-disulfide oxidoreductase family protein [Paenibacillus sp. HB172176]|uniref:thiol-disulfide oxidoreductase DCC family protein n=1 Tax=Paenibacillus sp. HB172176 TaxID=2493690 RepID=UPI0019822B5E|nr:DCC1-like thiol-disulfide oxidoreductase family protein [Paenibacillus sp. HB172176]